MKALEDETKPVLEPLIKGTGPLALPLSRDRAALLARWATKTAIIVEYLGASRSVSVEARRSFMETLEPPPSTYVWIGHHKEADGGDIAERSWVGWDDRAVALAAEQAGSSPPRDAQVTHIVNIKLTCIIVGHVMFVVFLTTTTGWKGLAANANFFLPLWPDRSNSFGPHR